MREFRFFFLKQRKQTSYNDKFPSLWKWKIFIFNHVWLYSWKGVNWKSRKLKSRHNHKAYRDWISILGFADFRLNRYQSGKEMVRSWKGLRKVHGMEGKKGKFKAGRWVVYRQFSFATRFPTLCSSLFPSPFLLHVCSLLCFPVSLSPAFRLQSPASFPLPRYLFSLFPAFLRFHEHFSQFNPHSHFPWAH